MTWGTTVPSAFALGTVVVVVQILGSCGLFAAAVFPHEVLACNWLCSFTAMGPLFSVLLRLTSIVHLIGASYGLLFSFHLRFLGVTSCSRRALFFHVSRFAILRFELCPLLRVATYECAKLALRAPNSHHPHNVMPWFQQSLGCLDELLDLSRADPRAPLCTFSHVLCVVWWTHDSSTRSSGSSGHPEYGCDRDLRSASASGARSRRNSVVTTLRSCARCVWLCASWSVGTSRRRHACND